MSADAGSADDRAIGEIQRFVFAEGQELDNETTLRAATYEMTRRCMQSQGFRYFVQRADGPDRGTEEARYDRERASRTGYGLAAQAEAINTSGVLGKPSEATRAEAAYRRTLTSAHRAAYDLALTGPEASRAVYYGSDGSQVGYPGRGCVADASRAVYGSVDGPIRVNGMRNSIGAEAIRRVESDHRYGSAMRQWSECMSRAGVPATTPAAAVQELTEEYRRSGATDALVAREIRTAVADLDCALEARVREIVTELRAEHIAEAPGEQIREIEAIREMVDGAVARAERILAEGGR